MTGELQETVSCSAITEKRPNRLSGCVGVFFQLFDWNRRFAKKKLFSRKSLLPGKHGSKRFGGDDKMLKSKLHLIDDEKRGSFPNVEFKKHEMRSPSLVARLMGLDSIPSNNKDKGNKKKKKKKLLYPLIQDNDKYGLFDEEEEEEEEDNNGFDKSRPQKLQRTAGVSDRRVMVVKKFGSDALQIKNVLTRVRKHHHHQQQQQKLVSPVRSPRLHRRNSRLIDAAAARILEPGKRNAQYAVAYPGVRRRENVGKETVCSSPEFQHGYSNSSVASCKACGSFVDVVHGSNPVAEEIGKSMAPSKRNVFWRNQEPSVSVVPGRSRDFIDQMERKVLHRARYGKDEMVVMQRARFAPVVAQSYNLQSKRGCSSSPVNTINCKEKDFIGMNRGLATSMNHHHHSKARFENSDLNLHRKSYTGGEESFNRPALPKRRLACVSGHGQGSSSMSPVSRSLHGDSSCACSNETKDKQGVPSQMMGERNLRTPLDSATVSLIQQKLKELASQEEDDAITGSALPNKPASLILHELLSSIADEQPYIQRNANSDYTSPGSVLDASFSNESCFSNSFDNISAHMRLPIEPDWDALFKNSTSSGNYQAITSLITHVSNLLRCLSNTGLISTHQRFTYAKEVIIHTELSATQDNNYLIGPELFDELMIYAARSDNLVNNLTGITGGFLVDAMIEHLEERNVSCGLLKPWSAVTSAGLIRGVLEEVPKWAVLARIDMDEVIEIEMEKWMMDVETHLFGVGSEIAYDILWCLVGELAIDLSF